MKFFAVLALAAVAFADPEPKADAEADPALLYGAYGYPYAGVYGGYRAYGAYPATYGYGYRTYGAYPYSYYGKRSASTITSSPTPRPRGPTNLNVLPGSYSYQVGLGR